MKYLRILLFTLTVLMALSATLLSSSAQAITQVDPAGLIPPPTDPEMLDPDKPPLLGGAPYPFPIIIDEGAVPVSPEAPAAPAITVWYGNTQNFGQLGTPQEWINILGSVTGATTLTYSLNNGPEKVLSIGPDGKRLQNAGDFNIELAYTALNDGANTVLIKAGDGATQATQVVTVNYDAGNEWPLPYATNWTSQPNIQAWAQVVDGQWAIGGGTLNTVAPGYDRLVTFGSMNWTDYEVEVPVTIHSLSPSNQGSGVGMIVRWLGHYSTGDDQPLDGWRRLGALAWARWTSSGNAAFEIRGHGGQDIIEPRADIVIEQGVPYIFKLSVQSSTFSGNAATYRFKYWPAGQTEPPAWNISATGNPGEPASGSVVLVAHHANVSWGNATVRPIDDTTYTINVQPPANGSIIVTPDKDTYTYGETVTIRAQGLNGYNLAGWTGSFSGVNNPLVFDITEDITVGATFAAGPAPKLILSVNGQGDVSAAPQKNNYLNGELVTLTPEPALGFIFAGWSGDLSGADNPAVIVMSSTKNITANFISANADSPISDDFNACALDTGLWTFVNPVGDGTYSVNGTQLLLNVPANVSHNIWTEGNRSVRVMQPTQNVDFEIITKFESFVTQRYQMQGILVEQDSQNFLRFEVHHDGSGVKLYAARFLGGAPRAMIPGTSIAGTPAYLRVTRVGTLWSFSYSDDGDTWVAGGSFTFSMTVTKSGVFGANHGTPPLRPAPAHTAIVDYFFNSAAPIVPEDGNTLEGFSLTVNEVGQGTVTISPDKPSYTCGETVTLTAVPANGWSFLGWGGDLGGTNPTQQLTVSGNHNITATFTEGDIQYRISLPLIIDK